MGPEEAVTDLPVTDLPNPVRVPMFINAVFAQSVLTLWEAISHLFKLSCYSTEAQSRVPSVG